MAESPTKQDTIRIPEKIKSYPGLHFEPTVHSGPEDFKRVDDSFDFGDLRAHDFNPESAERMSEYQPVLVALDGAFPVSNSRLNSPGNNEAKVTWIMLPDRPLKFNKKGEVYIVQGDLMFYYQSILNLSVPDTATMEVRGQKSLYEQVSALEGEYRNEQISELVKAQKLAALSQKAAAIALSGMITLHALPSIVNPPEGISRRRFLAYSAGAGLSIGLALSPPIPTAAREVALTATSERKKDLFQSIAQIFKPRFGQHDLLNARTALLIAKTQDSIDFLNMPADTPAAVVMGANHLYEAGNLMNNPQARAQAIDLLVGRLVKSFDQVIEKFPRLPKKDARNSLLDYVTAVDLTKVIDPGGPDLNPDLKRIVDQLVIPVASFKSPQVEATISQYRM